MDSDQTGEAVEKIAAPVTQSPGDFPFPGESVKAPDLSIVILAYNRCDSLMTILSHIKKIQKPTYEIIVVDNASQDDTVAELSRSHAEVRLIKSSYNQGVAAYNLGFEAARGIYTLILDDDSYPAPEAMAQAKKALDEDPKLGVVAFHVRYPGRCGLVKPALVLPEAPIKNRLAFNGAGAMVRTDLLNRLGGYCPAFFLYQNELDLSLRIVAEGFDVVYFPHITGFHLNEPKNRHSWRAPFYYCRNAFWVIWQHYPMTLALVETLHWIYAVFRYSWEQKTPIYCKAFLAAWRWPAGMKRRPLNLDFKQWRISRDTPFGFFR
jgi:hypothetical protein